MKVHRLRYAKFAFVAVMLKGLPSVNGGDVDPPPGPVGPTMLTLEDLNSTAAAALAEEAAAKNAATAAQDPRTPINPMNTPGDADSLFKITAPESYYVTGNIDGVAGKSGIEIAIEGTDNCGIEFFNSLIRGNTFGNPNGTDTCGSGNTLIANRMSP